MNEVREIVTKAVVAKGKKTMHISHSLKTNVHPYSILGCWIINHEFEASKVDDIVDINGTEYNIVKSYSDASLEVDGNVIGQELTIYGTDYYGNDYNYLNDN